MIPAEGTGSPNLGDPEYISYSNAQDFLRNRRG